MPLANHYLTDFSKLFSQTEFCFQGKYPRLLVSVIHLTEFYWVFASHSLEITLAAVKEKMRRQAVTGISWAVGGTGSATRTLQGQVVAVRVTMSGCCSRG